MLKVYEELLDRARADLKEQKDRANKLMLTHRKTLDTMRERVEASKGHATDLNNVINDLRICIGRELRASTPSSTLTNLRASVGASLHAATATKDVLEFATEAMTICTDASSLEAFYTYTLTHLLFMYHAEITAAIKLLHSL